MFVNATISCTPHLTTQMLTLIYLHGMRKCQFMVHQAQVSWECISFLRTCVCWSHNECLHSSGVHDACKGTGAELYHVKEPPLIKEE